MTRRAAVPAALVLLGLCTVACGGAPQHADPPPRVQAEPVDLTLVAPGGRRLDLSALRGRPVLLFVFTTYDQASQLALTPLTNFLATRDELQALGIAAQPDPEELLPLYRSALAVPFPLVYEPVPRIVAGESALGRIDTVPTYVLLDAGGRIRARHTGAMKESELETFTEQALSR